MNKYSAVQYHLGGHNCQQGAHMHWQGAQVFRYSSPTSRFSL